MPPHPSSPAGLLLVVTVPASGASAPLLAALAGLPMSQRGPRYEGHLPPDCDEPLRRLAATCADEGSLAFVFAELPPPQGAAGPYQRLWDRTDDVADEIAGWKAAAGAFPALRPGDIVRL